MDEKKVLIGAALSLTEVREVLDGFEVANELIWLLDQFSSTHVRNVAVRRIFFNIGEK